MFEISHKLRVFIALHFQAKTSGEGRKIGQGKIYMGFFYVMHAKKLNLYPQIVMYQKIVF